MSERRRTTEDEVQRFADLVVRMAHEYGDCLRIGQMILNAIGGGDLYYLENPELLAALEADLVGTPSAVTGRVP